MKYESCPTCNISWLKKENIIEHFIAEYSQEGIPAYLKEAGIVTVDEAARSVAASYGCHEEDLKYFSENHVSINCDKIIWLHCDHCGVAHDEKDVMSTTLIFREDTG